MILNYQIHQIEKITEEIPLVFIHGLFGSLTNLGMLAREFYQSRTVIQIDLRNHGHSFHSDQMNYHDMAQDVLETLEQLNIKKFSVIGHSMGGKVAMQLAQQAKNRIEKLIILDIAPYKYTENHHDQIFKALFAVQHAECENRQQATKIMREHLAEEMVIQFLMKSFHQGKWLFNVNALFENYSNILDWTHISPYEQSVLFIRGGQSAYISKDEQFAALKLQFPHAKIVNIENVGHWLHAEKPQAVLDEIQAYL